MRQLAIDYDGVTGWIVRLCPPPDKFAHTYAGLAIWLAALILWRRGPVLPLALVVAIEVLNEVVDRIAHGSWMWADTLGDMAATWFWPVIITAAIRWGLWPNMRGRRREASSAVDRAA